MLLLLSTRRASACWLENVSTYHLEAVTNESQTLGSQGSRDLHKAMMEGMQEMHSMKMSGDTDLDFASMMIYHHEQAIAMSKVKRKANEIIAASEKNIAELYKWKSQHSATSR